MSIDFKYATACVGTIMGGVFTLTCPAYSNRWWLSIIVTITALLLALWYGRKEL